MKSRIMPLAVTIQALGGAAAAFAQSYGTPPAPQQQVDAATPSTSQSARSVVVSKGAYKAIQALQAAVDANDKAAIAANAAAAKAVAKSNTDLLMIAQLELKAAAAANDQAAIATALESVIAYSGLAEAQLVPMRLNLAKLYYGLKAHDRAAASAEKLLAVQPGNTDALLLLGETRYAQGRPADAVAALQRAILVRTSAGQKADEGWYKRAIAIAYEAKLPSVVALSRDWVAAYPSAQSWSDALRIYRNVAKPDDPTILDTLRLGRVTNSLAGDNEFHAYAYTAMDAYALHEAKSVIEEGIAAGKIDRNKALIKEIDAAVSSKVSKITREGLGASAREALADPSARFALRIADAHYGLGDYAKAAELYKAALGKTGADANLIGMRLGIALARAGDKAGASAAFSSITGPRAELAKFWLLYLSTKT